MKQPTHHATYTEAVVSLCAYAQETGVQESFSLNYLPDLITEQLYTGKAYEQAVMQHPDAQCIVGLKLTDVVAASASDAVDIGYIAIYSTTSDGRECTYFTLYV